MKLSIVVPVYNSQKILPELIHRIKEEMSAHGLDGMYELILVNDCSPDDSWAIITSLAKQNPFVRGVALRKNFGQHSATMAGLSETRGDVVVIMDDDLQHPPSEITNLMAVILEGTDVCYTRYIDRQHPTWKKLGSKFNDRVAGLLLDKPRDLYLSSFKALSRELVQEVIKYNGPYAYLDGLILNVTRSIKVLDINHQPRHDGEGNYNLRKSISLWLRMATSFSVFPLRVATVCGMFMGILSLIFTVFVVVQKILNPSITAGWTSLAAIILFVGGIQTFCLGLLGEYLGRTYLRVNGKPQFVVREKTWTSKLYE